MPDYVFISSKSGQEINHDYYFNESVAREKAEALSIEFATPVILAQVVEYEITVKCAICGANVQGDGYYALNGPLCNNCHNTTLEPDNMAELTLIFDEIGVPTAKDGRALDVHQRAACLAGMYEATRDELLLKLK